MKARSCIGAIFVIIALLFVSVSGYSKHSTRKGAKRTSQKSARVGQKYSVRSGDNLGQIAKDFGTTIKAIRAANGLKSSRIKAGQVLRIPVVKSAATQKKETPRLPEVLNTVSKDPNLSATVSGNADEEANEKDLPARIRLVQAGFKLLGVRYRFGASGNGAFDCSGLVKSLFSKFDINLPRSSREQFKQGEQVNKDDLQIGDLVFFSSGGKQPTHVGIYIGNNQFLHAARKAKQVVVSDLGKLWYTMRYLGARRIAGLWGDEPVTE